MPHQTETEFKLRTEHAIEIVVVDATVRETGITCRTAESLRHVDTWLDDELGSLVRAGIGLRVREDKQGQRVTCKLRGTNDGGLFVREEHEAAWPAAAAPRTTRELPPELRDTIEPFVLGRPLVARLRLETQRELRLLQDEDHDLCELAVDRVLATAAGRTATFWELELEVIDNLQDTERLAARLGQRLSLRAATDDKPTHAAALLGLHEATVAATPADDTPIGTAIAAIAARHLDTLRHAEVGVRCDRDPGCLHTMRVAVRRLRCLVRAFRDLWPADTGEWLLDQLGATGRQLGTRRDLDVMLASLPGDIAELPASLQPAAAHALTWISVQREPVHAQLQIWLRSEARQAAEVELEQRLASVAHADGAGTMPSAAAVPPRLAKAVATVRKLAAAIAPDLPTAPAHELRLATKRLRYLAEEFATLANHDYDKSLVAVTRLQQVLGTVCDHETGALRLVDWIATAATSSPDGAMTAAALGGLAAQHTMLARKARKHAARCLERTNRKRVWRRFPQPPPDATLA